MIMHSRYLKCQTFSNLENAGLLWISEWKISVEGMFRKKFLNENSKCPTYSGSTTNIQWCGDNSYLLLCVSRFWNNFCAFSNAFPSYAIRSSNSPTDILKYVRKPSWYSFNSWITTPNSSCCCLLLIIESTENWIICKNWTFWMCTHVTRKVCIRKIVNFIWVLYNLLEVWRPLVA